MERHFIFHEEFYISPRTMAVIPIQYGSKLYSKIIEREAVVVSPYRPFDVVKRSCRYYASTFEGRREGTRELIGVTHKAPIVIDPVQSIYFFPTTSPAKSICSWISHEYVTSYEKNGKTSTEVIFSNGQTFTFPISFMSFDNQMMRTALLKTKMLRRIKEYNWTEHPNWLIEAMEKKRPYKTKKTYYPKD